MNAYWKNNYWYCSECGEQHTYERDAEICCSDLNVDEDSQKEQDCMDVAHDYEENKGD